MNARPSSMRNGERSRSSTPLKLRARAFMRLLYPGLGLKRWVAAGAFGVVAFGVGLAYILRGQFTLTFPDFLPWHFEALALLAVGTMGILLSMYGFYKALTPFMARPQSMDSLADNIYNRWSRNRGPKIVAIGGGTGLSVLLRGLREHTSNLTAVISVGDDGGSSGRLRRELGVLPPGDFRNCLVAMSDDESLLSDLFQYRFDGGDGLKGHNFGNLFIAAMTEVTGNFEDALVESSRVLAVPGKVVPASVTGLRLVARFAGGGMVNGESNITERGGRIERLSIEPERAAAHPLAVRAIEEADVIVLGPGSLYTSILPNLMVRGVANALRRTDATIVYVCNVATEKGETDGYSVSAHVETLQSYTFDDIADYVIANGNPPDLGQRFAGDGVIYDGSPIRNSTALISDLVDESHPVRHDSRKLARAIMDIHQIQPRRARREGSVRMMGAASADVGQASPITRTLFPWKRVEREDAAKIESNSQNTTGATLDR